MVTWENLLPPLCPPPPIGSTPRPSAPHHPSIKFAISHPHHIANCRKYIDAAIKQTKKILKFAVAKYFHFVVSTYSFHNNLQKKQKLFSSNFFKSIVFNAWNNSYERKLKWRTIVNWTNYGVYNVNENISCDFVCQMMWQLMRQTNILTMPKCC